MGLATCLAYVAMTDFTRAFAGFLTRRLASLQSWNKMRCPCPLNWTAEAAETAIVDRALSLGFGALLEVTLEGTEDRRSMWRVVILPQTF